MGDLIAIGLVILSLVGAVVGNLIANDLYERAPMLARWIVKRAVRRLTIEERSIRQTEWLGELTTQNCGTDAVRFALGCFRASFGLNSRQARKSSTSSIGCVPRQISFGQQALPDSLRRLSSRTIQDVLKHLYGQEFHTVHERDVAALAGARLIHHNLSAFDVRSGVDDFLQLVTSRLLTPQMGGRSFALGALASLLRPSLNLPFDQSFIEPLQNAAEFAIRRRTFLNPEFGLLISASLFERFPKRDDIRSFVKNLTAEAIRDPQTEAAKSVATEIGKWLPRRRTVELETVFDGDWLEEQVVRPHHCNLVMASHRAEAESAVDRVEQGLEGCSDRELYLVDQMIRLRASRLLQEIAGHAS